MKRNTLYILLFILPLVSSQTAPAEDAFSLYGYLGNFFQGSFIFEGQEFQESSYGNTLSLCLKGDWRPEDALEFHLEMAYSGRVGTLQTR